MLWLEGSSGRTSGAQTFSSLMTLASLGEPMPCLSHSHPTTWLHPQEAPDTGQNAMQSSHVAPLIFSCCSLFSCGNTN